MLGKRLWYLIGLIIILLIIYFLFFSSNAVTVTTTRSMNLSPGQSVHYQLGSNNDLFAIYLVSSTPSSATFYVSKVPVLTGSVSSFSLAPGSTVNVSSEQNGVADLGVRLSSSTSKAASVILIYIPSGLGLRVSGNVAVASPSALGNATTTIPATTAGTTTTVVGATTTQTTLTTTVLISGNAQAAIDANASKYGILMNQYRTIYRNGVGCTAQLYNSTYTQKYGSGPAGINSYSNVSKITPTDMSTGAAQVSGTVFNVNYTVLAPIAQSTVLTLKLDVSSNTIINATFKGYYQGLTYSTLSTNYNKISTVGNACAALVP